MPAKSKAQANLMRAAEHGAAFPMAKKVRASMTPSQLRDYATGSTRGLPEHKTAAAKRQRAALRATTESHAYNNRSRNNLKRGSR